MNAARLLALYEQVAEAPNAIGCLRRFVLDLAVRGKLVAKDPHDESASQLLKRIAVQKARLVKAGEIRKPRALPPSAPEHWPFTVPKSWKWARVDELSPRSLSDGDWIETKDQSEGGGIRLIQLADIGVGTFLDKSSRFITAETEVRLNCTRLAVGDVLIARLPNPIGRACIFPDIGQPGITAVDVAILRLDENVSAEYVVNAMNAPSTRNQIEAYGKGATRFRVSTGHLKTVLIPLPPLAEQRRIVAKVEELMALLDQLEAARTAREATRDRLTAASLARLTAPDTSPEVFPTHARFALGALPALTARHDQIKSLRQTILNLAVRGELVEQDLNDEPASDLLRRIQRERAKRIERGELRKSKGISPPKHDAQLFKVPDKWTWCVADQLWDFENGDRSKNYPSRDQLVTSGIPFVNAGHLVSGRVSLYDMNYISRVKFDSLGGGKLRQGDQVYCLRGSLGKHAVFDLSRDAAIASSLVILRPVIDDCVPYLSLYLDSDVAQTLLRRFDNGSAQPNLSSANLRKYELPLPPLAEQHRIVARVDALMTLCDHLETALAATDTTKQRLLEALLYEALESAAVPRETEVA